MINDNDSSVIDLEKPTDTAAEDRGDVVVLDTPEPAVERASEKTELDEPQEEAHKPGIPKARFDEVNEKRKEAERQLAEAQQQIEQLKQRPADAKSPEVPQAQQPTGFDMKAQEKAYTTAMMEGDEEKALQIRESINDALLNEAETRAERRYAERESARQTGDLVQKSIDESLQAYPYLDTEEGADALGLIMASRDAKIRAGMPPHQAIREAVELIAPKFAPDTTRALSTSTSNVDTRSADALRRGAADSNRQPPQMQAGIGNRATASVPDVGAMDDAQFAAMSDADKRRLRGD